MIPIFQVLQVCLFPFFFFIGRSGFALSPGLRISTIHPFIMLKNQPGIYSESSGGIRYAHAY